MEMILKRMIFPEYPILRNNLKKRRIVKEAIIVFVKTANP